ncbi:MAG: NAD(P)/FAD-dependent oxidoreductase [Gammaproteobacteria bacterium]|nr:MAG: NAD(P)/FAD-dependent oxidoreductase [Gammaproteobacteria bacterium]
MLTGSPDVTSRQTNEVIILGAGLAGLGAGYALSRSSSGTDMLVIEADKTVGGLAKTVNYRGFRFDLGGHRFKTSNPKTEHLIRQVLKNELLVVGRSSKILLRDKYFDYPLKPLNAIFGFGIPTVSRIILDYAAEQLRQRFNHTQIVSLEDWVVRHFGRTLFDIYFKEYSEKVWGINCNRICMEWMEQRIQKLSLGKAIKKALFKYSGKNSGMHTLASDFLYPSLGIGRIADRLKEEIEINNRVLTNSRIVRINHNGDRIESVTTRPGYAYNQTDNQTCDHSGNEFISSIPVATLVQLLHPRPPTDVLEAASRLKYRDLVVVTIMLNRERVTDQTWIYIPEQKIPFGRIHEPTNWSSQMAPEGKTLLVTEHFCFRGDDTWSASDEELAERTISNLVKLGFIKRHEVIDKVILRIPRAYPLFEVGYTRQLEKICTYLDRYRNLRLIGRGGMFRYYNMDHTLESGITAAESLMADRPELFNPELFTRARNEYFQTGTGS